MRLIVLDRDGVINEDSDEYIKSPAEWIPIPGSLEAIGRLNRAGYHVVVATNQSGIGRGLFDLGSLHAMHEKMHRLLAQTGGQVDAIFFCPHRPDAGCACRKPRAGLLREIGSRFHVDLRTVVVIGDSLRDLEAARSVGATPLLVRTGKGRQTLDRLGDKLDVPCFEDLAEVTDRLLEPNASRSTSG